MATLETTIAIPWRRLSLVMIAIVVASVAFDARADSALNSTSIPGNQLNPTGLIPGILTDPRGMSRILQYSRSPTGLLYRKPFVFPQMVQDKEHPAWWHSAWVDIGALADLTNTGSASFSEYGDWSAGFVASAGFLAENRKNANYVSASAGSIGRADQYYDLRFGRYGVLNVDLSYKDVPHVLATNAKILWTGVGTDNLVLPAGLTPGATTPAQVDAALTHTPVSTLRFTRSKAGMSVTYTPVETWEIFLNASNEWREGKKAIGTTFWFPSRGAAELVQPVKYRTTDVSAGLRFKGEEMQANLTYAGSFFRNDITSLAWDNPGLGIPPGSFVPERGRIALAPNNDYHTVKGDLSWVFSKVRFAASASYGSMKQDGALVPPVINDGLTPLNLDNWNTIASLSQKTADAAIETIDAFAQFQWNLRPDLDVTIETRYRNEDNKTDYLAFNPLTMEYGYMGLDGALSRIYVPTASGSDVPIRNIPFAADELKLTSKVDYRFATHTRVDFSFTHKEIDRQHREVLQSNDNVVEAQLSSVGHDWGTVRFSYVFADRNGSAYVVDPYLFARSPSLPGYIPRSGGDTPYAVSSFRKYDVADRREHTVKLQSNFILSDRSDLQLTSSYRRADYDGDYGLRALDTYDVNVSYTNQITNDVTFDAFYGFQFHRRDVASINPVRSTSSDDTAGGPNYPLSNAWSETANDANHVFGVNIEYVIDKLTLNVDYTYSLATSEFAYSLAGPGAISGTLTPLEAGVAFPDQKFDHHVLQATLGWAYSEKITLRWYYRLEHEELDDFHYTGLTNVIGNYVFLGTVPEPYTAHVIGMFTQYRF